MPSDSKILKKRLKDFGLSNPIISAAWPEWWSNEAEKSVSARNELRFTLARRLGLDARSLFDEDEPRFIWHDEAKFKHFSGESDFECAALTSYGIPIGRALIEATPPNNIHDGLTAEAIRKSILANSPNVSLKGLISLCWGLGIPVIHLRVFPLTAKRMCAMTVNVDGRFAIMIGKDSSYPAQVAYYLAHELGHIFLGHLKNNAAVVEFDDILKAPAGDNDQEEQEADHFALEVLTGNPTPTVITDVEKFIARDLAEKALAASEELQIEPGTLALCLGHSTGKWDKVMASMKVIYDLKEPLWKTVNTIAETQIDFSLTSNEFSSYLHTVMGLEANG